MLNRLNSNHFFKTSELAEEFNVTMRTVQRDLELLDMAGFPIIPEDDKYKFMNGFSLQKISVTPTERFLLNIFFELFSKAGEPLDSAAKGFLNKLLLAPKDAGSMEGVDDRKKKIIRKEIGELSKSIEAKLEDLRYPPVIKGKIQEFLDNLEGRVKALAKKNEADITFKRTAIYEQPKSVAAISVPKDYFKDSYSKLDFEPKNKYRVFEIKILMPNKQFRSLRAVLMIDMCFKFWGPHLKTRKLVCFDDFAGYLGFGKKGKELHYEASYGSSNENVDILITRAGMSWMEDIPMPKKEIEPFLKKTGGLWLVSDYSKKGKE
jgi:gas vesicle protein